MSKNEILKKVVGSVPFWLRKHVKDIPLLKQIQAGIVKRYLNDQEFESEITGGPAKGLNFPVKMPDDKLMWIGTWEIDFSNVLSETIQPGWVCYDIGGYKGYYAGIMALKKAQKVIVFEPMPANVKKIEQLIAINPGLPIELKKAAVSDHDGKAVFKVMAEATMGKLEKSSFQDSESALTDIEVDCISLDSFVSNKIFPLPDFLKIDVEGGEEFVIKGGLELFRLKRPMMMIEIHSPEIGKRVAELLRPLYNSIKVFETGRKPGNGETDICHYIIRNN